MSDTDTRTPLRVVECHPTNEDQILHFSEHVKNTLCGKPFDHATMIPPGLFNVLDDRKACQKCWSLYMEPK